MLRAMRKDPAERFPDADEFIAALESRARGPVRRDRRRAPRIQCEALEDEDRRELAPDRADRARAAGAGGAGDRRLPAADARGARVPEVVGERRGRRRRTSRTAASRSTSCRSSPTPCREDPGHPPAARARARGGGGLHVTVFVSSGPGEARGAGRPGAGRRGGRKLREAGFKSESGASSPTRSEGPRDRDPAGGGPTLLKGSTVTLVVSRGREQVAVPDVVGRDARRGRAAAASADLASP